MIESAIKFATIVLLISSLPLIFITLLWCVSLGAFPYFDAVHSSTFVALSAVFTLMGFFVAGSLIE